MSILYPDDSGDEKITVHLKINPDTELLQLKIGIIVSYLAGTVFPILEKKLRGKSSEKVETVKATFERILKNLENDGILNNPENAEKERLTSDDPASLNIRTSENVLIECIDLALRAKKLLAEMEIDCPEIEEFANLCKSGLPPEKR